MTFAEALVYAARFANASNSQFVQLDAYCAVLRLRGEEMPLEIVDQDKGSKAMLEEFRRFTPVVRAQPPSLMETLITAPDDWRRVLLPVLLEEAKKRGLDV